MSCYAYHVATSQHINFVFTVFAARHTPWCAFFLPIPMILKVEIKRRNVKYKYNDHYQNVHGTYTLKRLKVTMFGWHGNKL